MNARLFVLLLLLPAAVARADDGLRVTYAGTLYSGAALFEGTIALTLVLHADPKADSPVWSDEFPEVPVHRGRFTVALGSGKPLDPAALAGTRWLAASVKRLGLDAGYVALGNRQRLVALPYARALAKPEAITGTLRVRATATFGGDLVVEKDLHAKAITQTPFVLHETVSATVANKGAPVVVADIPPGRGFCALLRSKTLLKGLACSLTIDGTKWKLTAGYAPANPYVGERGADCVAQCVTW